MPLTIETLKQMSTFHAISALRAESHPQTPLEMLLVEWLDSMADALHDMEAFRDLVEEYGVSPESIERLLECHPADPSTQVAILSLLNDEGVHSLDQLQALITQSDSVQTPSCPTEVLTEGEDLMSPVTITTISIHEHSAIATTIAALAAAGQLAVSFPADSAISTHICLPKTEPVQAQPTPPETSSAPPPAEEKGETHPVVEAPKATETQPTEASAPTESTATEVAQEVTYKEAADAVTKLARTKGREAAVAVLTKFGAAKLPDVKPEHFAAVIAECEAVGA